MKLSQQVIGLKEEAEKLKSANSERLSEIEKALEILAKEAGIAGDNWAGNWYNNSSVYKNFITGDNQHVKVNDKILFGHIGSKTGIDFESIKKELKSIVDQFKNYNENLITELILLKGKEQFDSQIQLIEKMEIFEWGFHASKIVNSQKPKKILSDYKTAKKLMESGFDIAPHITYSANVTAAASQIFSIREYLKTSLRLLRETELLLTAKSDEYIGAESPIAYLNKIFTNFHDVARLLVNRHANRDTIILNDEYDVQDLLRSLLKIFFDDVRPEDYTPSHAGRNTRVDFLLKKEKIIIEVKKTRETLKDKEVGDELLQDIARYKNHPDCETLYCFVYDPGGFISNPRGLENDLASESTEKMTVYVSIKP